MTYMKIIIAVISILIGAVSAFLIAVPAVNNKVAKDTARELAEIPLPENTQYIESVSLAGKLVGNGNGMQFLGAVLLKSGLPLEELEAYYSDYAAEPYECIVESQPDNRVRAVEHGTLEFRSEIDGDGYFIVYSWGSSDNYFFSDFDLRGH